MNPPFSDVHVNLCKSSNLYNMSQRFPFIVYDFRPIQTCAQIKNSLKIDSVQIFREENVLETTQALQNFIIPPAQPSHREEQANLFKIRKRLFNFFFPFNSSDGFTIYLSYYIFQMQQKEGLSHQDSFRISLTTLRDLCTEFQEESKTETNFLKKKLSEQSLSQKNIIFKNEQFGLIDLFENVRKDSPDTLIPHSMSTPDLQSYNILDQPITNLTLFEQLLTIIQVFHNEKFQEINILYQPANITFSQYPFLDYSIPRNRLHLDINLPNEIIENKLYLGNAEHAKNQDFLIHYLKVTHIVNAAKEVKNHVPSITYLNVQICDEVTEKIKDHFKVAFDFINHVWEDANCRILVHCAQGRSRSAALVIMFLMRKFKWDLQTSHKFVQDKRDVICVNDGFLKQLAELNDQQQEKE